MGKVLVVLGTRPEAIKMAPVIRELARHPRLSPRLCVTGQHREMLDQALGFFGLAPDDDLGIMRPGQDLADVAAGVLVRTRNVLRAHRPELVLVHGDTTTTFAAALAAFYERVPVGHVEAGLRTGDLNAPWPEEMNRRVATLLARLHFAPTPRARENLLREGVEPARISVTGNTVVDALLATLQALDEEPARLREVAQRLPAPTAGKHLVLVTGHRRENFGAGIASICAALRRLVGRGDVEVIYPVHLNPRVDEPVRRLLGGLEHVHLLAPVDYLAFVCLMRRATLILTDSGGVQEEAPSLGKPVLVLRETTERPEAVEAGVAILVGADEERIVAEAERLLDDPAHYGRIARRQNPYGDGRAAERIVRRILEEGFG